MFRCATFLFCAIATAVAQSSPAALPLSSLQLPPGFRIALYSQQPVADARQLALSRGVNQTFPNAVVVYVGSTGSTVTALVDLTGTATNVTVVPLLADLDSPNGVAWHEGSLFVAELRRITRYDNADAYALAGQPLPPGVVVAENWNPVQRGHPLHFIRVGPDNLLYVPQGSPSNTGPCQVFQNISQCAINRMALDGTDQETYVAGVRNSVGFDWDDEGNLWATSNARDQLDPDHNNRPDDPLLFIPSTAEPGQLNFGFPQCHFQGAGDPLLRAAGPGSPIEDDVNIPPNINTAEQFQAYCAEPKNNQPPSQALGPHVAALGMRFYRGSMFPPEFNNTIFIAQHGSWNRDQKIGYRVMNAVVEPNGTTVAYSNFAQGWLQNSSSDADAAVWGRPVDVLPLPDGSLLVSDDGAGTVYRITYDGSVSASSVAG